MSGTSRAWFKICAPELYCEIYVRSPRTVRGFIEDLPKQGSHIAQHTRVLWIPGSVSWSDFPKLVRLLPGLHMLQISGSDSDEYTDTYHPNLFRLTCRMLAASRIIPALTELLFQQQKFHSAADVLRLFASLPRLSRAELWDCSITSTSELVPCASASNVTQLTLVFATSSSSTVEAASLAQWWQWSHPAASPTNDLFPGLHITDSLAVCSILKSLPHQ